MTTEGIKRIINLFKEDIDKLTYTLDKQSKEQKVFKVNVTDTSLQIIFKIDRTEKGKFDNFKLVGKDKTVYSSKTLQFTKDTDEVLIEFPFEFRVEEVSN